MHLKVKHNTQQQKIDKRRIKISIKVLDEVKVQFPETNEFIEEGLEQERWKENISIEEVNVITCLEVKI